MDASSVCQDLPVVCEAVVELLGCRAVDDLAELAVRVLVQAKLRVAGVMVAGVEPIDAWAAQQKAREASETDDHANM